MDGGLIFSGGSFISFFVSSFKESTLTESTGVVFSNSSTAVLELEKTTPVDSVRVDSLKLETKKEIKEPPENINPPSTEESQLDQESLKEGSKKQIDLKALRSICFLEPSFRDS